MTKTTFSDNWRINEQNGEVSVPKKCKLPFQKSG